MEHFNELFDHALWIAPGERDVFPIIRASFDLNEIPDRAMLHSTDNG